MAIAATWGAGRWSSSARRAVVTTTGCLALGASVALGAFTTSHDRVGLLVAALIAVCGLVMTDPLLVPVAAFPATLLIQRAGSGQGTSSVTVSDLVVVAAAVMCLLIVRWEYARALQRALVPALIYEVLMLLTVAAHPNQHDGLEWAHRLEMLVGALVVGWVVAASGRAKQAVTALLAGDVVLALVAVEQAVALHFQPAQWGAYQKNYIGAMLWIGVVIAHLNPTWVGVPPRFARAAKYACLLGVLASQSKQAIIALMAAILMASVLQPSVRRRSRSLLAALVPVLVAGYLIFAGANESSRFSSSGFRLASFSADFHIWMLDPIFGEGMRWFRLEQFSNFGQPPNIFFETVTDGGIIGLIALIVLLAGSTRVLLSLPRAFSTIAVVLVVGRCVEALFDQYWVSAGTTLPWMVAGLALGAWDAKLLNGGPGRTHHALHSSGSEPQTPPPTGFWAIND
jgi:hypothetical protein